MTRIISSQKYIDYSIVDEKVSALEGSEKVSLPIVDAEMQDEDGNDLYVLVDGHHTMEAAKELGIEIEFVETDNIHNLTGEDLLVATWMDSDWYDVQTGITVW